MPIDSRDERMGRVLMSRASYVVYQGRSSTRRDQQERGAIKQALRAADRRKAQEVRDAR